MAHRGRLNVLTNIAGKSYAQIFREFSGTAAPYEGGSGDVKYHLGTEGVFTSDSGKQTQMYVAANPSHLEAANTVLEVSSALSRTSTASRALRATRSCRS